MNETIQTILSRRSIRRYKPDPIPDEIIKQIVNAGLYAPSGMGRQPQHIVIISSAAKIRELDRQVKEATAGMYDNPYQDYVGNSSYSINYNAPLFMIVSGDVAVSPRNAGFDCALLLGNMFLAAHSLGIGSCWINQLGVLNDESGFREYMTKLGIPKDNRIFGCACFGYPDGEIPEASKRKENTVYIS